jgi:hypothetical protein
LGFGGPGLKIHVLKEHSCPAPVLEGEGRIYSTIFLTYGHFEILGKFPKTPKTTYFRVRSMNFWPESPALGVEKWISGFFWASGNQKPAFLHPRKVPPPGRVPWPLFLRPESERPLELYCKYGRRLKCSIVNTLDLFTSIKNICVQYQSTGGYAYR